MDLIVDDLSGPQIAEFLDAHVREMRSVTPLESKHALDLDGLRRPEVTFWTLMDGATVVGCGAIKRIGPTHGEIKSMRTAPDRKRSGLASVMMQHIITEAARTGLTRLSLETGSTDFFEPARRLYDKFGFSHCAPFADYKDDPNSVFMTRTVSREDGQQS